ncbi:efflux RND transporter permease subunit [Thiohalorhabdus sp.]|uniref:efflux RND transporter permease subunit n=1 Tax=Thiohalorhabdus sp. TaxID=3094134 RepID=UPI002FC2995A
MRSRKGPDRTRIPAGLALAVMAALVLVSLAWVPFVKFNNAPEAYLPPSSETVTFERSLRARFPEDQVLVALFEGPGLWQAEAIQRLDRLARRLEAHERVERVLGITTVDHIGGTRKAFRVGPLVDPDDLDQTTPEQRRRRAASDPLATERIVSSDGSSVAMVVRPVPLETSPARASLQRDVERAIQETGLTGRLTALAGEVALDTAEFRTMVQDSLRFLPVTAVLGLALVGVLFRRWLPVALTALGIPVVLLPSLALLAIWGQPYTLVHSMVGPLLTGLSVALALHLYNGVALASRRGLEGRARVARALAEVARPARLTALTTATGLASLGLSPIPPIRSFGLITAAGVLLVWGVFILLMPPLLARWDRRSWPPAPTMGVVKTTVRALARLGMRRAGLVLLVFGAGLAVGLPWIAAVRAETDLYRFFPDHHPLIQSMERFETKMAGVTRLEVVFQGSGRDALLEPERLKAIAEFQSWLESQPEIDRTFSPADFVAEMNWAFHEEDPDYRRIPDSSRLVAQYLLVYDGRDLYDLLDRERSTARLAMSLNVHGANAIQGVMDRIRARLQNRDSVGMQWRLAGTGRLFADQEDLLISGQVRSILAAFGIILLLMAWAWKSLRGALLGMVPNLAPVALIFVLMGLLGVWLNMATALIASVAVGIAVDDTIHTYHGFHKRRRAGRGLALSLARTYQQAGQAVTATTLILAAQFLILAFSDFQPIAHFGLLSAAGIAAAWLFDLLLLPALLVAGARLQIHFSSQRAYPGVRGNQG